MLNITEIANEAIELMNLSDEIDFDSGLPTTDFDFELFACERVAAKYGVNPTEVQQEIWNMEAAQYAADAGPYGYIE